jgi:hypothetical protein
MKTKQEALNLAKQNNIVIKPFKNENQQGYMVGISKVIYCGYGNMFKTEDALCGNNLGEILFAEINKQLN